jgi:hypothetical protein
VQKKRVGAQVRMHVAVRVRAQVPGAAVRVTVLVQMPVLEPAQEPVPVQKPPWEVEPQAEVLRLRLSSERPGPTRRSLLLLSLEQELALEKARGLHARPEWPLKDLHRPPLRRQTTPSLPSLRRRRHQVKQEQQRPRRSPSE